MLGARGRGDTVSARERREIDQHGHLVAFAGDALDMGRDVPDQHTRGGFDLRLREALDTQDLIDEQTHLLAVPEVGQQDAPTIGGTRRARLKT